jgi:predicted short-subunit dehydrogenase-like oxidoreductase (DUF2520 family)
MRRKKVKGEGRRAKEERAENSDATSSSSASSSLPDARVTVSVVGAGRLGTALALALSACGYSIASVVARRASSARRAASLLGAQTQALAASRLSELPPADILFITTPDDAIAATASRLAETLQTETRETGSASVRARARTPRVALHASGALSSDMLAPLRACGFHVGSMHPLIAVSDASAGAESLRRAFYCTEGDARAVRAARNLVRSLGGQSFTVATGDKALYHAAAVMTSGHTVALFDLATELLAHCGLAPALARRALLPLLDSTLDNLSAQSIPARALTGSFARADAATIRQHLAALRAQTDRTALHAYALLGQRSLHLAEQNGADAAALREIRRALDEVFKD